MGLTKDVMERDRAQKKLREDDVIRPRPKPKNHPKQSKAKPIKSAPVSKVKKIVLPPKPKPTVSTDEVEKRKKENPSRKYIVVETETESAEKVRRVKKTATYVQGVKKPSGDAPPSKKTQNQGEPSGKSRGSKKKKYKIDESLESGKVEFIPPKSLEDIKNDIVKDGKLNNLAIYYENIDDKEKRAIEEEVVQYMNNFSRVIIKLSSMLPKELYDILDIQRNIVCRKDEEMQEYVLVNTCLVIYRDEVERFLKLEK